MDYRFHGTRAKLPIKSRSALPFFACIAVPHVFPTLPRLYIFLVFRHSRNLSNLATGSQIRCGENARRATMISARVRNDTTDNLFVKKGQEWTGLGGGRVPLLPPVGGLPLIPLVASYGNLTRPRDESTPRRECELFPSSCVFSPRARASCPALFFLFNEQEQPKPNNLCPKTQAFLRQSQTYAYNRNFRDCHRKIPVQISNCSILCLVRMLTKLLLPI